jgi:hypothetical protein
VGDANSDDEYASAMMVDPEQGFIGKHSPLLIYNLCHYIKF